MKVSMLKKFIYRWNVLFQRHPWIEAFFLSIIAHIVLFNFIWLCCQIHVMIFPNRSNIDVIEIEFITR